jgi:sugar phosphate isomerase/epimerase
MMLNPRYTRGVFKNLNFGALGISANFEQTVAAAAAHGFPGVDLDIAFLSRMAAEKSPQAARDWFGATGLRAGGMGLSVKWQSEDESEFQAGLAALEQQASLAASLGCTRLTTWVMPASNTLPFRAYWDLAVRRLGAVARVLGAHGMRLGLEFIGPATLRSQFKYAFVHSMDAMLGLCAAIGPNTGLLLDCFHAYTAKVTQADLRALHNDDVVYVHLNDAQSGFAPDEQIDLVRDMVCATGVIDIKGFVGALRTIGYDGPLTVEPFSKAVKAMSLDEAAAYTSRSIDQALA